MPVSGYYFEGDTFYEQLRPPFRNIRFGHEELEQDRTMMVIAITHRKAWLAEPQVNTDVNGESSDAPSGTTDLTYSKAVYAFSNWYWLHGRYNDDGSMKEDPQPNRDLDTIHTPWRDGVYHNLCRIFAEAIAFLRGAAGDRYGHYHSPDYEVFSLDVDHVPSKGVVKKWDRHVMFFPVYLASGTTVRLLRVREGHDDKEYGKFDIDTPFDTWFMRRGEKCRLVVERQEGAELLPGPAVVMQVGLLTDDSECAVNYEESSDTEPPHVLEEVV